MKGVYILVLSLLLAGLAAAQGGQPSLRTPTLSPMTEISQDVALTNVKLVYSRPSAKGRKVFGDLVPFNEVWRTGANASTKLTFTEDVVVAGNPLKAGTYALYTIPGESEWTMIIHGNIGLRALVGDAYKQENDIFRFKAKPAPTGSFVETFTIQFANIRTTAVDVVLSWENTMVPFTIEFEVASKVEEQIAELLKDEANANPFSFFLAAEYYFHNDRDLTQAEEWITTGLEKRPKEARFGLLLAKILHKRGRNAEALKVIAEANAWAREKNDGNYTQQTQLFWDSIKD